MSQPTNHLGEAEDRPWEKLGGVRRDCEPHRGPLLKLLGSVSLTCGILALCAGVPGLIGFPLGIWVSVAAKRDLDLMATNRMDPLGGRQTEGAGNDGHVGAVLSFFGLVLWLALAGIPLSLRL